MAVLKYYDTGTSSWQYIAASTTANFTTWKKTVAGGETSVSGTDDNAVTLSYTIGLEQVFINGVLQVRGSDYTATTGTSITGLSALAANDVVTVICYAPFNVANTIAPTLVDAKGDLLAGTAADTVGRLAVGTNDFALTADSTQTTGLKWTNIGLGSWTSYTPTVTQGVNVTKTVNVAKYIQRGKTVTVCISMGLTSAGTAGSNIEVSVPITAIYGSTHPVGSGVYYRASGNVNYAGTIYLVSTTTVALRSDASSFQSFFGNQPNLAAANIDGFDLTFTYEVA